MTPAGTKPCDFRNQWPASPLAVDGQVHGSGAQARQQRSLGAQLFGPRQADCKLTAGILRDQTREFIAGDAARAARRGVIAKRHRGRGLRATRQRQDHGVRDQRGCAMQQGAVIDGPRHACQSCGWDCRCGARFRRLDMRRRPQRTAVTLVTSIGFPPCSVTHRRACPAVHGGPLFPRIRDSQGKCAANGFARSNAKYRLIDE